MHLCQTCLHSRYNYIYILYTVQFKLTNNPCHDFSYQCCKSIWCITNKVKKHYLYLFAIYWSLWFNFPYFSWSNRSHKYIKLLKYNLQIFMETWLGKGPTRYILLLPPVRIRNSSYQLQKILSLLSQFSGKVLPIKARILL